MNTRNDQIRQTEQPTTSELGRNGDPRVQGRTYRQPEVYDLGSLKMVRGGGVHSKETYGDLPSHMSS